MVKIQLLPTSEARILEDCWDKEQILWPSILREVEELASDVEETLPHFIFLTFLIRRVLVSLAAALSLSDIMSLFTFLRILSTTLVSFFFSSVMLSRFRLHFIALANGSLLFSSLTSLTLTSSSSSSFFPVLLNSRAWWDIRLQIQDPPTWMWTGI